MTPTAPVVLVAQTAHWVQVLTTNTPSDQMLNNTVSYLDHDRATTPYYDYGGQDQRGFQDFSQRPNIRDPITWHAEMHLAVETAPYTVTVFPDGIEWGWSVQDRTPCLPIAAVSVTSGANPTVVFKPTVITATFTVPPGFGDPTGKVEF